MTAKEMWEMPLHEIVKVNNYMAVMRVPGGWIYNITVTQMVGQSYKEVVTNVFVPLHNEFLEKE